MKTSRGPWVIALIFLVALGMALAMGPLLKLRRARDIRTTEALIAQLEHLMKTYQLDHGDYPGPGVAAPVQFRSVKDAWGRPLRYRSPGVKNPRGVDIWSLGPDPDDPSDDIDNWSDSVP